MTTLSASTLHRNANKDATCPIWTNIEGVTPLLSSRSLKRHSLDSDVLHHNTSTPNYCSGIVSHSNFFNSLLTPPIEVFFSILELRCHYLHLVFGIAFVIPSLCRWEVFPMLRALLYTRLTWALSSTAPQVPGVTPMSSLCPWCCRHSSRRDVQHYIFQQHILDFQIWTK